ncbi:MAG TPA: DUF1428 domain-containing protein [Burkholderiales bacterium]|nr:DUF1428 domain-containing protein [Burkholderiales bacterium]
MMAYVDAVVVPVPKKKLAAYRALARRSGKVWREHGALEYLECVADDVKPGKRTSFPQSVKLKAGETVVFAYIVYKSRAQRDRVMAKVMKDKRLADMMDPKNMPFDGKRMFWGGFKPLVRA